MVLYCSSCDADSEFERPPCADGHVADCPELACVGCGAAILLGTLVPDLGHDTAEQARPRHVA